MHLGSELLKRRPRPTVTAIPTPRPIGERGYRRLRKKVEWGFPHHFFLFSSWLCLRLSYNTLIVLLAFRPAPKPAAARHSFCPRKPCLRMIRRVPRTPDFLSGERIIPHSAGLSGAFAILARRSSLSRPRPVPITHRLVEDFMGRRELGVIWAYRRSRPQPLSEY